MRHYSTDIQEKIDALGSEPQILAQTEDVTLYRFDDGIECIETNGDTVWEFDSEFDDGKAAILDRRLQ